MTRRDDKPRIKGAQSDADEAASRMTRGGIKNILVDAFRDRWGNALLQNV